MKIEDLVHLALLSERISTANAEELMNYGISEILKLGVPYSKALIVLERAQTELHRSSMQRVSFGTNVSARTATDIDE